MSASVCIATQHPSMGGGVLSMVEALVDHVRAHDLRPSLFFPSKSVTDALLGRPAPALPCPGYHYRSVPYLHLLTFWLPAITGRRTLRQFAIHHAVGGCSLPGLPLYLNRLPYVCWVATTMKDEWAGRYRWNDFSYRNIPCHANVPFLPLLYHFEKRVLEAARWVFALSEHTARCLRRDLALRNPNVEVMPFLVDTEHFSPEGPRALEGLDYILFCGRANDPRKNFPLLVEAFARARQRFPGLRLVVAGPPPKTRHAWAAVDRWGVRKEIVFLGGLDRKELPAYYRGARLKVLSSLQEGLAIVVLEAMACGVPVVSTRCGGPEEIVEPGKTGLLTANRDAEQLAAAIEELLADESRRREMGLAARERVLRDYSLFGTGYRFVARYREIYPHCFS